MKELYLIGFKDKKWFEIELGYLQMRGREIIFSGSKSELLNMPEEFWENIVEVGRHPAEIEGKYYMSYSEPNDFVCIDARTAGITAMEKEPGEYFIILKEKI